MAVSRRALVICFLPLLLQQLVVVMSDQIERRLRPIYEALGT
jgi:hypothetical protein